MKRANMLTPYQVFVFLLSSLLWLVTGAVFAFGQNQESPSLEEKYERYGRRAVERDAFPVFHNPELATVKEASEKMRANEWVIGVSFNGDHRAYPIEVMGVHELGNDTVGGKPITVCW